MKNKALGIFSILLGIVILIALGVWAGFYFGSQSTPIKVSAPVNNSWNASSTESTSNTSSQGDDTKVFVYGGYRLVAPKSWNISSVYYSTKKITQITIQNSDYSQPVYINVNNPSLTCAQFSSNTNFYCKDINKGPFFSAYTNSSLSDITKAVDFIASNLVISSSSLSVSQNLNRYNLSVYNSGINWNISPFFKYTIQDIGSLDYPIDKDAVFFKDTNGDTLKILVGKCEDLGQYYPFDSVPSGMSVDNVISYNNNDKFYKYISSTLSVSPFIIEYVASGLPVGGKCLIAISSLYGSGQDLQNKILQSSNEIESMLTTLSISR